MPKVASTIADRIAQHKGFVVPQVPKFMPRRPSGDKFGSPSERFTTMKSDKVDSASKMAPSPLPSLSRLLMALKGLFAQALLQSMQPNIGGLFYVL
ncbi:hypothetical protein EV1_029463 [Malus domestica]